MSSNLIENFIDTEKAALKLKGKFGWSADSWLRFFSTVGAKWCRSSGRSYDRSYFGLMFYWFAIFWNNSHPDMRYGEGVPIPWHGFTILWGANSTGKPGELLWKHKKEIFLWR